MAKSPPRRSAPTARSVAAWLLSQVLEDQRLLSEVQTAPRMVALDPSDRARAQRLATDCLRDLERCDRVLKPFLRKPPPGPVMTVLRLATAEICLGGDAHGVVNEAVSLTRSLRRHGSLSGLVNAVLRQVAQKGPDHWAELRPSRLPKWIRQPLVSAWGGEAVLAMEHVQQGRPPVDLSLKAEGATAPDGQMVPTGSLRLQTHGQISGLAGYDTGDWWVQDAAAALPVRGLGAVEGMRVLDLCAAPGGKTLQLAAAGAHVTALDISEHRLGRVHENLARCGLAATVVCADALSYDAPAFDAVVLDAPCSATGTIRRHPDLPHAKDGAGFEALFDLQAALLDRALALVKPSGKVIYCTCSLLPDEGEVQVLEALSRHPDVTIDKDAFALEGVDRDWITPEGGLRLRPDYWAAQGGMDGFYMACLRRPA